MDLLEGRISAMDNIMLVLHNEKGEISQDELESIPVNIPEKTEVTLSEWHTVEAEMKGRISRTHSSSERRGAFPMEMVDLIWLLGYLKKVESIDDLWWPKISKNSKFFRQSRVIKMPSAQSDQLIQLETTCGTLLYDLQLIWDEIGQPDDERDKMLLQLEQECLEVYRRKVDQANRSRAQLHKAIADYESELASIISALGDRPLLKQGERKQGSLKQQLEGIAPLLEEMRRRKEDRVKQFVEVQMQIQKISNEIAGCVQVNPSSVTVEESDLSLRKLEEYQRQLQTLQEEKNNRLFKVIEYVNVLHGLCSVLGLDFIRTVTEVHPSLEESEQPKSISDDTIERLAMTIHTLREVKKNRMQKLQDLATTMLELWNLMDTPIEEQQMFQSVTCNIAASEHEICSPNSLSEEFIESVEAEVARLEELKGSKMKELVLKKRTELEEICRRTHLFVESNITIDETIASMDSGLVDPSVLLETIEEQIAKTKEEAFSRKEILEKIEKWMAACEEEVWLEDYNKDENRYSASRGAHLTLKRAERARAAVSKLPSMVEGLVAKTLAWEEEWGKEFLYDRVPLLQMLEDYNLMREQKEQERRRQRDQKRLHGQLMTEQEALFGSKPSPAKPSPAKSNSARKTQSHRPSTVNGNRRLSLGGAMLQAATLDFLPPKANGAAVSRHLMPNTMKETRRDSRTAFNMQSRHEDDFNTLSAGRRGLDVAGLNPHKHSFYSHSPAGQDNEINFIQPTRRPLSPVPTTPSQSNANSLEDIHKMRPNGSSPLKTIPMFTPPPNKSITVPDEENMTPASMAIPMSITPVKTPLSQTATPLLLSSPVVLSNSTPLPHSVMQPHQQQLQQIYIDHEQQGIEYSFEEKRAGFILLNA
ncbi:hypothetical protein KI387_025955 [Taxus chinensis]|uniref:65-kDa microtubule-associated protein 3 n=1 Tax=Taxus chinensis TaxID=29808 RepID=A0AA38FWC7_TAXCH|nr:hypothetical protein KI387_025955 [Taxus chinensis]